MKILIDIGHPAQLNFYLNSIKILSRNHEILVTFMKRGKLPKIVEKELGGIPNVVTVGVGNHRGTYLSIIFEANLIRILKLMWLTYKYRPDIEFSNGFMAGIAPTLLGIKACHFQDDPELGTLRLNLMKIFANKIYIPFYPESRKIKSMNALKEWAYLSPTYFKPEDSVLIEYNLSKKNYIFVREVITSTFNYEGQEEALIESIAHKFSKDMNVVLSLEDKSRKANFPNSWIILEEPVNDLHSLMYYSKLVLSSGDSMAREGAQLGVPSIYCGFRKMHANKVLMNEGLLFHVKKNNVLSKVEELYKDEFEEQKRIQNHLLSKWDDVTKLIVEQVNNMANKNNEN